MTNKDKVYQELVAAAVEKYEYKTNFHLYCGVVITSSIVQAEKEYDNFKFLISNFYPMPQTFSYYFSD